MQEDGATLREHLESAAAQTGRTPPELEIGELPEGLSYVWDWFWTLAQERQTTDEGTPKPLSSEQIKAWQELRGVRLTNYELGAIRVLDRNFMLFGRKKSKRK